MKPIICSHCGSMDVYSVDNQPLDFPDKMDRDPRFRFDSELYVEFECMVCEGYFDVVFNLTPQ